MRHESKVGNIPDGGIILWRGAIVDIPAGFILCDGENGSPDLRNKFIPGAGQNYDVADTGGTETHTHSGESAHIHYLGEDTNVAAGVDFAEYTVEPEDIGSTGSAGTLPTYYALAYIMKT